MMSLALPLLAVPFPLATGLLLAAIDPFLIKVIVVIVVMSIAAINKLGKAASAQQRKPARPAAPPRPRPQPGRGQVEDEVSEFLKRAAEKRAGRPVETPKPEPPRRLIEIGASDLVEVQAIEEPPTGAAVAQHVRQHLDTREFTARASHLTTVDRADEAIESHLHQFFEHQVGHLASQRPVEPALEGQSGTAPTTPDVTAPAEYLVSLLGNPQSLRSAVILSEVLQRPTQRWS
jgi:hypothetical protein